MHKPESILENEMHKILRDFEIQMDHPILIIRLDLLSINKKKRTCTPVDFAVPAYHSVKMKESKKIDKYLDLAKERKKLWNMKRTVIAIAGFFREVSKGLAFWIWH